VSVFGASSARPGDAVYEEAERLGRLLALAGAAVATGGYSGVMEAVSKGAAEAGGWTIGYTCAALERWHGGGPNPWVRQEVRCQTLRQRAARLLHAGRALIALPGGVGTFSEVGQAWSLLQTGALQTRPLILVGKGWRKTMETFLAEAGGYVASRDAALLGFASTAEGAAAMLAQHLPLRRSDGTRSRHG
jgi:uncharacterized protein (TIGR00730 family)